MELCAWGCPQGLALQQKAGCPAVLSRCVGPQPRIPLPSCVRVLASLTQSPLLSAAQLHPRSCHTPTAGVGCCLWLHREGFCPCWPYRGHLSPL